MSDVIIRKADRETDVYEVLLFPAQFNLFLEDKKQKFTPHPSSNASFFIEV